MNIFLYPAIKAPNTDKSSFSFLFKLSFFSINFFASAFLMFSFTSSLLLKICCLGDMVSSLVPDVFSELITLIVFLTAFAVFLASFLEAAFAIFSSFFALIVKTSSRGL